MIEHIVLLRPAASVTVQELEAAADSVRALEGRIDGLRGVTWGPNVSPEGLGDGYDVGFVMTFDDAAARDAYLVHPEHLPVAAGLQRLSAGILVFDLDRAA